MSKLPTFNWAKDNKDTQIMIADNMFPKSLGTQLIDECKAYYEMLFTPGPTIGGVDPRVKSSMDCNLSVQAVLNSGVDPVIFGYCEEIIRESLAAAVGKYINEFSDLWAWPGIQDTGFRLQKYRKAVGYYRTHVDGTPWEGGNAVGTRVLGAVIYLNDVAVGGETAFPAHNCKVSARAGRIVLFPTNWTHPHSGSTPISEDKWMISTFMTCVRQEIVPFDQMTDVDESSHDPSLDNEE